MITAEVTVDLELVKNMFTNEKLYDMLTGGNSIPLEQFKQIDLPTDLLYVIAKYNEEPCGFLVALPLLGRIHHIHGGLLPEYWGQGLATTAFLTMAKVLQTMGVQKIISPVPDNCYKIKDLLKKAGLKLEGRIENGIYYRDKLVGLNLYGLELNEVI